MKKIANILTFSRIILSLILLIFFNEITIPFLVIFAIAEFTDIIDGTIARKSNSESSLGAVLDTIADILLASNILKMALIYKILEVSMLIWFICIVFIALVNLIIGIVRFKKIIFNHNVLSKILGGVISLIPFGIYFNFIGNYLIFALLVFMLAMIDNLLIIILTKEPDTDIKFFINLRKINKEKN